MNDRSVSSASSDAEQRMETLWNDGDFVLSRGRRGNRDVILVTPAPDQRASPGSSRSRLEHAHSLRDVIDARWAARPAGLLDDDGHATLVLEDPGGEVLAGLVGEPWEVAQFLRVAAGLAATVAGLHERGLVHKDIKPAHVLVDKVAGKAWLMGFGIASSLAREQQTTAADLVAGTLPYMAPEQTGRMNRSVDSRSDLYSLGVTLYQLVTGDLPFSARDPVEWMHCHLALQPVAPEARGVPGAVSAIIMRLLAKTAEDRYQTAAAVEADLRQCLASWEAHGRIVPFPLGASDRTPRLVISERLYGRKAEAAILLGALQRVKTQGRPELVLVSGYSGVGKSSLVGQLQKVVATSGGLFASGKYDPHEKNIPYTPITQAFRRLVRGIVDKGAGEIATWRPRLLDALVGHGQLLVDFIPDLELVVGRQPPLPEVSPRDARARLQQVLGRFAAAFARPEQPLALFLDDLQWLDRDTLDFVEYLTTAADVEHLLLVGAYRDNEVGAGHPLRRSLDAIRSRGIAVEPIHLGPLAIGHVTEIVADALRVSQEDAAPLGELVYDKTGGNPFFVSQFLSALADAGAEDDLVRFDAGVCRWRWDLERIRNHGFTDDVVELMANKLGRFASHTREALGQLACLGSSARIAHLVTIRGDDEESLHAALWEAAEGGMVVRTKDSYAFVHDRIHEAAYALVPPSDRARQHLRIGRLLSSGDQAQWEEDAFEIANQLNRGASFVESTTERQRVAEIALLAARRARLRAAYSSALTYSVAGRALLTDDCWESRYELLFALELLSAECELLTGAAAVAEERLSTLAVRARGHVDRAAVACMRMTLYTTQDKPDRAVAVLLEQLAGIGVHWSEHPTDEDVRAEFATMRRHLGERAIEELVGAAQMTDPEQRATLEVLITAAPPVMFLEPNLFRLIIGRMITVSLQHGNAAASCLAYVFAGMVLGPAFGDYDAAFRFGKVGFDLVEKPGLGRFKARVYLCFGTLILPWARHLRGGLPMVRAALKLAEEAGDLEYASFRHLLISHLLSMGTSLPEIQREAEEGQAFVRRSGYQRVALTIEGQLGLIRSLRGLTTSPGSFRQVGVDDDVEQLLESDPRLAISRCRYLIRRLQALYYAGEHAAALEAASAGEHLLWTCPSLFESAEFHIFKALSAAGQHDSACAQQRPALLAIVRKQAGLVDQWAGHSPQNFEGLTRLVHAELARIEDGNLEALPLYEQAIQLAREQQFIQHEALASELAGRFCLARRLPTGGLAHLRNARSAYQRWGAAAKVRQLDRLHPDIAGERPGAEVATMTAGPGQLDLLSIVKMSQVVSREIVLEKLAERLLAIAVENAGATRGLLILPSPDGDHVEAEAIAAQPAVAVRHLRLPVVPTDLPESLLRFVARTHERVLIEDAASTNQFSADPYLQQGQARSALALPLLNQAKFMGVLYLENRLAPRVFTPGRIEVLAVLASQAAISLESARLYRDLQGAEARVAETAERLRSSLQEKEALLMEMHHRVKNNLQLISSLLSLQAQQLGNPALAELLADSRNRVRSIALVHENLYRADNFARISMSSHLRGLCAHLGRAYGAARREIELELRVGETHFEMGPALTCGLIVNELVSNALKHAFPVARPGRVQVELQSVDTHYILRVGDDGDGMPAEFDLARTSSVGLQLVRDLVDQLDGQLAVTRDAGTTFTITFGATNRPERQR